MAVLSVPEACQSPDDFDRDGSLHLVFALGVRTLPHGARLEPLLHHVRAAALGTLLGHGLAAGDVSTVAVAVAAVKRLALLGAAIDDLDLRSLQALLIEGLIVLLRAADLFGGLAIGVSGAGQEGAEAALLQDHGATAVFAVFLFALLGDFHTTVFWLSVV